jgi:hypothetical protein
MGPAHVQEVETVHDERQPSNYAFLCSPFLSAVAAVRHALRGAMKCAPGAGLRCGNFCAKFRKIGEASGRTIGDRCA